MMSGPKQLNVRDRVLKIGKASKKAQHPLRVETQMTKAQTDVVIVVEPHVNMLLCIYIYIYTYKEAIHTKT